MVTLVRDVVVSGNKVNLSRCIEEIAPSAVHDAAFFNTPPSQSAPTHTNIKPKYTHRMNNIRLSIRSHQLHTYKSLPPSLTTNAKTHNTTLFVLFYPNSYPIKKARQATTPEKSRNETHR